MKHYFKLSVIFSFSFVLLAFHLPLFAQKSGKNNLLKDTTESVVELQEAVVVANRASGKGSMLTYTPKQAAASLSVIGEPDVLRHISSQPGVSQGVEGMLGLFVRGGNNGSNGLYFNDMPLYVSSHLFGLVSSYPAEIINNASFYKGGFSAACGNQSSSVLDVETKHSTSSDFNGSLTLSPYLTGLYTHIPLVKNHLSVQVAARTTFAPYLYNAIYHPDDMKLDIDVYDITGIVDFRPTSRHLIDAMFFTTKDFNSLKYPYSHTSMSWGSINYKLGWLYRITNKLSLKFSAYSIDANSAQEVINTKSPELDADIKSKLTIGSNMKEEAIKLAFFHRISDNVDLVYGAIGQKERFRTASSKYYSEANNSVVTDYDPSELASLFADAQYDLSGIFDIKLGYRHTFQRYKKKMISDFDFHLLAHYYINSQFGVEATLDRMNQYYHQLEGMPTGWSMSILVPADGDYPPELTNQVYSGLFWSPDINWGKINVSLGGYYRKMHNFLMYKTSMNAFGLETATFREEVDCGSGNSYGVEFSTSLESDRLGGTLSYTLSKSDRVFPLINAGQPFPFKFDRRHILNLEGWYTFAKSIKANGVRTSHQINGVLAYSSGNRATLRVGYYPGLDLPYLNYGSIDFTTVLDVYNHVYYRQLMSGKNEFVMKDYFRIDMAYTYTRIGRRFTNEFALSVFNILNRHNPYMIFSSNDRWKQLSIMPIMPSVRWTLRW